MNAHGFELGFRTLEEEVTDERLPVTGSVPEWIAGALIRNGPGKFDFGDERANHWFDRLAMLRRYGFADGEIRYMNRFLRTEAYADAKRGATIGEFASGGGPVRETLRWLKAFGPPDATDNTNVHVARFGDHYVALTEVPRRIVFDPVTLETRGEFRWVDELPEHLTTAHVTVDPDTEETIGYATEFGRRPRYHFYRVPPETPVRERFATVDAEGPGYVHDCALTENYAVLVETPLEISVLRALVPWSEGLFDMLLYDETGQTRFIVVDRKTGEVVAEPRTAPFVMFHHVNAFDTADEVVVDLVEFEDPSIVEALSLDALTEGAFAGTSGDGLLVRYRLSLETGEVARSVQYDRGIEFPTVPRPVRGREYRHAYAQVTDRRQGNGLVKVDLESKTAIEWCDRGVYVEEPRMIRRPDAEREDEGVVVATALDTNCERTILLIFDAETLTERARATLPHALPFGFHGRFFPDTFEKREQ